MLKSIAYPARGRADRVAWTLYLRGGRAGLSAWWEPDPLLRLLSLGDLVDLVNDPREDCTPCAANGVGWVAAGGAAMRLLPGGCLRPHQNKQLEHPHLGIIAASMARKEKLSGTLNLGGGTGEQGGSKWQLGRVRRAAPILSLMLSWD